MSSDLLEPPGEEPLCVFLLPAAEEEVRWREVGCQWEGPKNTRDVGCQSDGLDSRDAAVQVDLLTQQLSWSQAGEFCSPPRFLVPGSVVS